MLNATLNTANAKEETILRIADVNALFPALGGGNATVTQVHSILNSLVANAAIMNEPDSRLATALTTATTAYYNAVIAAMGTLNTTVAAELAAL